LGLKIQHYFARQTFKIIKIVFIIFSVQIQIPLLGIN